MTSSASQQVLVVGAGPTGLAFACRCRQLGLDVRLIDRKPGPSTTSKATGLQYRVSEVLATLGVIDRFVAESMAPMAVNIYAGDRPLLHFSFQPNGRVAGAEAFQPRMLMIPQSRTEALLGEHFHDLGGRIEWGTELLAHTQGPKGVDAVLRRADGSEERWAGGWLVSCEGAHSSVRDQAGIAFQGKTYPLNFLLADVQIDDGPRDGEVYVWMHPKGSVGMLPMPGKNAWRCMAEISASHHDIRLSETEAWNLMRELIRNRVGGAERFTFHPPTWVSQFRIHCRMVDRFRSGRVFLAGDAAHIHSPNGGQGITTGMQDAMNLAWKLARVIGGAPEALLDTYEEERKPQAAGVLHQTDKITKVFFGRNLPLRLLRDWVILPVLRMEWMQWKFFGKLTQLHVSYRGGPLAREEVWPPWSRWGKPRAGERCPDVAFERMNGGRLTLLEALRPGRPVVLLGGNGPLVEALRRLDLEAYRMLPAGARVETATDHDLIDVHGDWQRLYGLRGDYCCLIRPDGHLGLVQTPMRLAGLIDFLKSIASPSRVEAVLRPVGSAVPLVRRRKAVPIAD